MSLNVIVVEDGLVQPTWIGMSFGILLLTTWKATSKVREGLETVRGCFITGA